MEFEKRKRFLVNFLYVAVTSGLIFLAARFLISCLLPFIIAFIIAFLMQCPAELIAKKLSFKKNIIAAILALLVYLIFAVLAVFLVYRLTFFLASLVENLPQNLEKIVIAFNGFNNKLSNFISKNDYINFESFWNDILKNIMVSVSNFVSNILTKLAKGTPSFLFSSVVALVASCYIAKDYDRLLRFSRQLIGERISSNMTKIKTILFESVFSLVKGYTILSFLTFLEMLIGLMLLRVENAFLIAFLVALVDVLPVLGTGTILIPWAVIAAFLGDIPLGIGLSVLYVLVVLIRNFSEPKIIGAQIGINPLFTLLAMFTGLRLFGVIGLFLFPVILIVVIKFYKE